jgi:hypothetical protein
MELSKKQIDGIIALLKQADGEDVHDILIGSGWSDQMLTQLIMTEPINDVKQMYEERLGFEQDIKNIEQYWIFESC